MVKDGIVLNFRFGKSRITALQMNVMRRNDDAIKYKCRLQKKLQDADGENLECRIKDKHKHKLKNYCTGTGKLIDVLFYMHLYTQEGRKL